MNKGQWHHKEDAELLQNFYSDGNTKWLGVVLERYTLLLYGVCMKYLKNEDDAKDTVQQIFLKALSELQKYKVEHFKSWLYTIAKNQCLMNLRNKSGKIQVEITENYIPADSTNNRLQLEKENLLNLIECGLTELNNEQKTCVTLFYLQNKSYQQISTITGYNLLQVKSYIQNGKRNLKQFVDSQLIKNNG